MVNRLLLVLELLFLIATMVLAVLWISNPVGNFEPFIILCSVIIAVVEIIRRYCKSDRKSSSSTKKTKPVQQTAIKLLDLVHEEIDHSKRGVVQICKELEPGNLYFFPRLQYNGKPLTMKPREFHAAIEELVERNWLFPAEYNESTDTITYESR